tara:strand:- start:227 stop:466 length:240 start_codon:yes stop_codon:yes gene_type:complete
MKLTKKELEAKVEELEASVSSWQNMLGTLSNSWDSLVLENRELQAKIEELEMELEVSEGVLSATRTAFNQTSALLFSKS